MSSRCAHGERTRADFHARMRSRKHTVVSAYELLHSVGRTRASRTVCLRRAQTDVTACRAGNVHRTNRYLGRIMPADKNFKVIEMTPKKVQKLSIVYFIFDVSNIIIMVIKNVPEI